MIWRERFLLAAAYLGSAAILFATATIDVNSPYTFEYPVILAGLLGAALFAAISAVVAAFRVRR